MTTCYMAAYCSSVYGSGVYRLVCGSIYGLAVTVSVV
jgi:hypothetical protein